MKTTILILIALLCVTPTAATAAADESLDLAIASNNQEMDLFLEGALLREDQEPSQAADVFLHLRFVEGQPIEVWGKGMTIFEHPGLVDRYEEKGNSIEIDIRLLVEGDFWIKGQWPAAYKIKLQRDSQDKLQGTFSGKMAGRDVQGEIAGELLGPRGPIATPDLPEPDEHPRLLFRKEDIPALKEKLKTPLGQAYLALAKGGDPINLGVLYQLTGDKSYAQRAGQMLQARHAKEGNGEIPVFGFGSGGFGHHIFEAVVTYDLCTDGWDEQVNKWLRPQLEVFTERHQRILMTSHANFHPCSNYYGPGRGVSGIASMALWGEKGPLPRAPKNPMEKAWEVRPAEGYQPGKGVQTVQFALGQSPKAWITSGLLPRKSSRDILARIGGYTKAAPGVGTIVEYATQSDDWLKMVSMTFQPLEEKAATAKGIDLDKLVDQPQAGLFVLHTAMKVDEAATVRRRSENGDIRLFVSGIEMQPGRFFDIKPGLHPVTMEIRSDQLKGLADAALVEADPDAQTPGLMLYRLQHDLWLRDKQLNDATGMAPNRQVWLSRGWFQNYQHYRWGVGDGGFKAETGGYANIASWYPSQYASMYHNFTGQAPSPHPDIALIMPRQIAQAAFVGSNPQIVKLNSALSLDTRWMACHYPIIPDRYKPAALWAWNRLAGVSGPDSVAELFSNRRGDLGGITLAQTFINYPLDTKPVHPSQSMPKTWSADTLGFYVHRNGYKGAESFIAQVFAKAGGVGGWNHPNAGGMTVYGMGQVWTDAPTSRGGAREQYSVVLLPEDTINQSSSGRITHHQTREDGSGSLTIDMSDVYAAPSRGLYDGMLRRRPEKLKESGITGLRAIGFDYSGASGAEALIVLVDKIDGGGKRLWTWQIPAGARVETDETGFTMHQGDAMMRATFILPGKLEIQAGSEDVKIGKARTGYHGKLSRVKVAGDQHFFVVLTFQKNQPPAVRADKPGLDAKVQVGGQVVQFDGQAVRFEKK